MPGEHFSPLFFSHPCLQFISCCGKTRNVGNKMNMKMNRNEVSFNSKEEHQADEREYWKKASIEEKVGMITYLRECFYGPEATTGRLQRFFEFSKQERC